MIVSTLVPNETDLREIVDAVTEAFLHEHALSPSTLPEDGNADDELWTGVVTVSGAFSGAVMLSCTRRFARRAARAMFDQESSGDDDSARDVLAELTTVIGGNVKGLFSTPAEGPCHLSIPLVSVGTPEFPNAGLLTEVWSQCTEDRIRVAIFKSNPDQALSIS